MIKAHMIIQIKNSLIVNMLTRFIIIIKTLKYRNNQNNK